jgi:hypothetical protein
MSNDETLAIVRSDGVNEDMPPRVSLEFVNVGAVSKAEKERNQKLIRSTAMRAFRRRQQSEKLLNNDGKCKFTANKPKSPRHSRPKKDSQSDEQVISPANTDLSSEVSFSEVAWLVGGSSNDRKADYLAFVEGNRRSSSSSESSRASTVVGSPTSPLGAGRVDPFRALPVESGSHINELIDHCKFHSIFQNVPLLLLMSFR